MADSRLASVRRSHKQVLYKCVRVMTEIASPTFSGTAFPAAAASWDPELARVFRGPRRLEDAEVAPRQAESLPSSERCKMFTRDPERKLLFKCASALIFAAGFASAQQSPPAQTSVTVGSKNISIKYSAPTAHGRRIFGDGGVVSHDATYPVWRAGANAATAFHTDADLGVGGLRVPKGDYTVYVLVKDPNAWELILNKQTGQWGLSYNQAQDLGRVKMTMSKPPAPIETLKYTLSDEGGNKAKLQLEWENHIAYVLITIK
jgi:hypothetical protein